MSEPGLRLATRKMAGAGVDPSSIEIFKRYYRQLEQGANGLIREDSITPLLDVPQLADVDVDPVAARTALGRTAVIKLNGGLGTSMGLHRAKSLLGVRGEATILDILVDQVRRARSEHRVSLPLVFMHSFHTQADCLAALDRYPDLPVDGIPRDFLQSQEPKLLTADLTPVSWPADPRLEWCPPGHGDLYPAISSSEVLDALLAQGYAYAVVSNVDNLGAAPDAKLAGWFAASGAPYVAELCLRSPADRKGGHLAIRRADGSLILRDTAQTAPEDLQHFASRHPYSHTNNLWFDLRRLREALNSRQGFLGLPLIRNIKTVDPTDPTSPAVYQLETAMGAAIQAFDGATAILVDRSRFLPVKTTNDLLLLRSDAYGLGPDGRLEPTRPRAPLIDLDPAHFGTVAEFEKRFVAVPSLREAQSLTVRGDWTFGREVRVRGDCVLEDRGQPQHVPDGTDLS